MGTDEQMGAGSLKFVIQGTPECGNAVQPNFCRCDAKMQKCKKSLRLIFALRSAEMGFSQMRCGKADNAKNRLTRTMRILGSIHGNREPPCEKFGYDEGKYIHLMPAAFISF